ncbi:M48 family metallopeptidase [Kibdelosporangium phytohabitans]|uniref:Uncharacterized protein n=1 Tax=Kibdelosporangium phytohabitans TaxID=860235 RepID=A0A0N9HRJ8_9PSEU|nr:M48 family metallopeptidase [Kibdelosporangium phytohabitans]ALG07509.1 hypothetical protein AOZ06_11815 [Kibdelosporangium phytohabitans]MBE1471571.1 hypothetical protein [Kibdelosporangium phytohabitans]
MLAGYLALLVALAAGVLTAVAVVLSTTWAVLAAIVVLLWLFAHYVLRRKASAGQQGAWINRKRHPDLWQMVDEVAEIAETRTPDELRLGPDMRTAVREQGGFRCLEIGLPLLGGLSAGELRAVTGHALALSTVTSVWESRLPRTIMLPYRLITKPRLRARHEQAEQVAISAAGEAVATSALARMPELETAWRQFRHSAAQVSYQLRTPDLIQRFNASVTTSAEPAWELLTEPDKSLPYLQRQLFEELGPEHTANDPRPPDEVETKTE